MNPDDRLRDTQLDQSDGEGDVEQLPSGTNKDLTADWRLKVEEIFLEYGSALLRAARNRLQGRGCYNPSDHAWDVLLECLTGVLRRPPQEYDQPAALRSYLHQAVRLRVSDHLRYHCSIFRSMKAMPIDAVDVERLAASEECCISEYDDLLVKFRETLKAREASIWDASLAKGLDAIEISDERLAERLGMSVTSLRVNRFRLKAKFAKFMGMEKRRKEQKTEQKKEQEE